MRTGLYKRLSNEELVELYKAGESDAFEALLKNTEGLRATLAQRYLNIPGSEFEDLMSEGAIEMLSAIQNFDSKNYSSSFSTFLYSAISRHYNDMFTAAVCEKRNPGCFVQSYEQVNSNSEYEEDGDSLVTCVNGSCPQALADQYPEYGYEPCTCEECGYYKGCEDCCFQGDELFCVKKNGKYREDTDGSVNGF